MRIETIEIKPPEGTQIIVGQAHFIKTVEDLYEALASSSPGIRFGLAFCESSGPSLVRYDGNDKALTDSAAEMALNIGTGHAFVILIKDAFPINVLNRIKMVEEVATIFCATGNAVRLIIGEEEGRGILGVIDGTKPKGIETQEDKQKRHNFLRQIGYKR
jgi:adenosine/AMP kinase